MGEAERDADVLLTSMIAKVDASPLFDEAFYAEQTGVARSREVAIVHYLAEGERRGFRPCGIFDPAYYLETHADVRVSGANALIHYLTYGQAEGRYPAVEQERQRRLRALAEAGSNEAEHSRLKPIFDESYYRRQRSDLPSDSDALHDYLAYGRWAGYSAAPNFNHVYYVSRYPDIDPERHEPLLHFHEHGRQEGRLGRPDFSARIVQGGRLLDPALETVLVVAHEASRTGAPLVALAVGEHLAGSRNVIFATGRRGSLEEAFLQASVATIVGVIEARDAPYLLEQLGQDYGLDLILLSSAETSIVAQAALSAGIASVGLVHEFAEYSFGKVGEMIAAVDVAIVPATLVLDASQTEMSRAWGGRAGNIRIGPQGILPVLKRDSDDHDLTESEILTLVGGTHGPRPRIVLGAGFVHIRKGLDLFVQTAAELVRLGMRDVRFIWVGDGYDPQRDPHYALWVDDLIKRLGLSELVFILGAQSSLDAFYDAADLFYLSSRLDPFPNVALDALARGKPLLCFREATGLAEWVDSGRVIGEAVPLADVRSAAERIRAMLDKGREHVAANAAVARSDFDFATYCAAFEADFAHARQRRQAELAVVERLEAVGAFDAAFFGADADTPAAARTALRRYVAYSSKGLNKANPRPGFNDTLYRARAGCVAGDGQVPLDHAIRKSGIQMPVTHRCVATATAGSQPGDSLGRVAIVLLDVPAESLARIMAYLDGADHTIDLLVVIGTDTSVSTTRRLLEGYSGGSVGVRRAPGRDRELRILLEVLAGSDGLSDYEVIGHIDGAGFARAIDRDPVLNLLTAADSGMGAILNLFASDPNLGLAFAEKGCAGAGGISIDMINSGWALMGHPSIVPTALVTPPGAMFWTRPAALAALRDGARALLRSGESIPDAASLRRTILAWLVPACEQASHDWLTLL